MDRDDPDGGGVVGVCRGGAGASRPAAPDDLEHAGGAAGRGLLAAGPRLGPGRRAWPAADRKSTRLNSSHSQISYAVFCLKKKKVHERLSLTSCSASRSV